MTDAAARIERVSWRESGLSPRWVGNRLLGVGAAAALGIDAYAHASDAYIYASNGGTIINQGNIFYAETAIASLAALLLLLRPRLSSWLVALAVAISALGAVVLYRYVDVGAIGPVPDLYEPTWQVPGKLLSAFAEGAAVVFAVAGTVLNAAAHRSPRGAL